MEAGREGKAGEAGVQRGEERERERGCSKGWSNCLLFSFKFSLPSLPLLIKHRVSQEQCTCTPSAHAKTTLEHPSGHATARPRGSLLCRTTAQCTQPTTWLTVAEWPHQNDSIVATHLLLRSRRGHAADASSTWVSIDSPTAPKAPAASVRARGGQH